MTRIVVTGGRDYANRALVYSTLDHLHATLDITQLMHGACPYGGADILAEDWAKSREVTYVGIPALFKQFGKLAGPARNRRMMRTKPDLVVAFPGGRGTANCVHWAEVAEIPIKHIEDPS